MSVTYVDYPSPIECAQGAFGEQLGRRRDPN